MPTPVGHALAGLTVAWISDAIRKTKDRSLSVGCVVATVVPDLDILLHHHRSFTHSIGAAMAAGLVVWGCSRFWKPGSHAAAPSLTIAAAYSTHILLDWLGRDTAPPFGLMALWPFSHEFFISGANIFMEISRRYWKPEEFLVGNMGAVGWEIVVLAPFVGIAFWLRQRST